MKARQPMHGAPKGRYARFYRMVRADVEDYFAEAKRILTERGFHVLDEDWWQRPANHADYVMVGVWARKWKH